MIISPADIPGVQFLRMEEEVIYDGDFAKSTFFFFNGFLFMTIDKQEVASDTCSIIRTNGRTDHVIPLFIF